MFQHMILLLILSTQQRAGVPQRRTLWILTWESLFHDFCNCNLFYSAKQYLKNISESCMALSVQKAICPTLQCVVGIVWVDWASYWVPFLLHPNASGVQRAEAQNLQDTLLRSNNAKGCCSSCSQLTL